MSGTTYIPDLSWTSGPTGRETKAEVQVEMAEHDPSFPPALVVAVHRVSDGEQIGYFELDKAKAAVLRDTLTSMINLLA